MYPCDQTQLRHSQPQREQVGQGFSVGHLVMKNKECFLEWTTQNLLEFCSSQEIRAQNTTEIDLHQQVEERFGSDFS